MEVDERRADEVKKRRLWDIEPELTVWERQEQIRLVGEVATSGSLNALESSDSGESQGIELLSCSNCTLVLIILRGP